MRRPVKIEALNKLKEIGVPIGTIIDVGVLSGTAELMTAFKDKKHLLIEPIVEYAPAIHKSYKKMNINYELINVAAADKNGEMNLSVSTVIEGKPITHARLTDDVEDKNIRVVPVRTVESLLMERALAKPYYLKIDVDGAEMAILEGAKSILDDCSVIEVEAVLSTFWERAALVFQAGFELFDIVNPCYYSGRLSQVDLIFLNSKMVQKHKLGMFQGGFNIAKWENYV